MIRLFNVSGRYMMRRFFGNFLALFGSMLVIIYIFDSLELLRRLSKGENGTSLSSVLELSLLKLPEVGQLILPFAVLFSAMMTLWQLTRRQELVILRSSGQSVWQFMAPMLFVACILGVLHVTVLNPVSAALLSRYEAREAELLGPQKRLVTISREGLWLKEADDEGAFILHAGRIKLDNWELRDVMTLFFDGDDNNIQRIDAQRAHLAQGRWVFKDATLNRPGQAPETRQEISVSTDMTRDDIEDSYADPETISFWKLPDFIKTLDQTGLSATALRIHYQGLLAQPLLLAAMVLLAAAVSLRPPRSGMTVTLIIIGLMTGFAVFFFSSFLKALGMTHQIPIIMAAWAPGLICLAGGSFVLLSLEDR